MSITTNTVDIRQSAMDAIASLDPGCALELDFADVNKVFPPGITDGCLNAKTLEEMQRFAGRSNCLMVRDDAKKAYIFRKSTGDIG